MEIEYSVQRALQLRIALKNFIEHVEELRNDNGFDKEFAIIRDFGLKIREQNTYPTEEGKKPYNKKKNRYKDILPFDATRVILEEIPGEPGSDYINANFIKDQFQNVCYIATQGPMRRSLYDFWRMIVQYKVRVIAMVCKLVEMGKKKCEQYWPSEVDETVQFRDISVTLMAEEEMMEHCTKRYMKVVQNGNVSTVTQFHYIGWPDHDISNDFDLILEMMAEMREIKVAHKDRAIMVVHCSAGCGRTGTICAIDYTWDILKSGNLTDGFSLLEIINEMRTQRQSMVQTPEQYMMAHVTVQKLFQKHLDIMKDNEYGNFMNQVAECGQVKGDVSKMNCEMLGAENFPKINSSLQNEIAQTLNLVTNAPFTHKLSEKHAVLQTQPELEPVTRETVTDAIAVFQVENLENMPYSDKYEDRENDKQVNVPLPYISADICKDLKAKTAVFNKSKPPLKPKNFLALDTRKESQYIDPNNNAPMTAPILVKLSKPPFGQVESPQKQSSSNFKTVISIEDVATKQKIHKSLSSTIETLTSMQRNSSKSLPYSAMKDTYDHLCSSSSFSPVPKQSEEGYSTTSSLGDYSTVNNSHFIPLDPLKTYGFKNSIQIKRSDMYPHSVANYSSANETTRKSGFHQQHDLYSVVDSVEITPDATQKVINCNVGDMTYSTAKDLGFSYATSDSCQADNYANVKRSKINSACGFTSEYESIMDNRMMIPPPISQRQYEDPPLDKLDPGESSAFWKKPNMGSIIKNLFSQSIFTNSPDTLLHYAIPGFKSRLGKTPGGPRQRPIQWQMK